MIHYAWPGDALSSPPSEVGTRPADMLRLAKWERPLPTEGWLQTETQNSSKVRKKWWWRRRRRRDGEGVCMYATEKKAALPLNQITFARLPAL